MANLLSDSDFARIGRTVKTVENAERRRRDPLAKRRQSARGAKLLLLKVKSAAAGTNKHVVDAYAPGAGLLDPTSASLTDTDLGPIAIENAILSADASLPAGKIIAGWKVGYTNEGKAAFVQLGGGGSEPPGEHQEQARKMVAGNVVGWGMLCAHPKPPF